MALRIILHTFRMIFGNFGQALRISVGPYLIAFVVFIAFAAVTDSMGLLTGEAMIDDAGMPTISPSVFLIPLIMIPLMLFVTAWVAVSWHRFILLEERASLLPAVKGRPIWHYAGRAILLGLLIWLISMPLLLVVALISVGIPFLAIPLLVVAFAVLGFVGLKMAVSLVGTALGKTMQAGEVWRATDRINGEIFGVVILLVIINVLPSLILAGLNPYAPIVAFVLNLVLSWITMMLGISVLTTIYGHVIEDRPLPN